MKILKFLLLVFIAMVMIAAGNWVADTLNHWPSPEYLRTVIGFIFGGVYVLVVKNIKI